MINQQSFSKSENVGLAETNFLNQLILLIFLFQTACPKITPKLIEELKKNIKNIKSKIKTNKN